MRGIIEHDDGRIQVVRLTFVPEGSYLVEHDEIHLIGTQRVKDAKIGHLVEVELRDGSFAGRRFA